MPSLRTWIFAALLAASFVSIAPTPAYADLIDPDAYKNQESPPLRDHPIPREVEEAREQQQEQNQGCAGNLFGFLALAAGISLLGFARRRTPSLEPSPMSVTTSS